METELSYVSVCGDYQERDGREVRRCGQLECDRRREFWCNVGTSYINHLTSSKQTCKRCLTMFGMESICTYFAKHCLISTCLVTRQLMWERSHMKTLTYSRLVSRCRVSTYHRALRRNWHNTFQVNCSYDEGSKMLMYFSGNTAAFIWKCSQ